VQNPPAQPTPPPPAPTTGPITYGRVRTREGGGGIAGRIALVAGSIWLLVLARDRFVDFFRRAQIAFDFDEVKWLLGVLVAIVAGLVFGLALVLPRHRRGYRTADLVVLGIVPFVYLIAAFLVIERLGQGWNLPAFVDRAIFHLQGLFSTEVTMAGAALLGIAIGFGFRGRGDLVTPAPGGAWS
jgi:hypothetical protein